MAPPFATAPAAAHDRGRHRPAPLRCWRAREPRCGGVLTGPGIRKQVTAQDARRGTVRLHTRILRIGSTS
jgi:hypothetical protein